MSSYIGSNKPVGEPIDTGQPKVTPKAKAEPTKTEQAAKEALASHHAVPVQGDYDVYEELYSEGIGDIAEIFASRVTPKPVAPPHDYSEFYGNAEDEELLDDYFASKPLTNEGEIKLAQESETKVEKEKDLTPAEKLEELLKTPLVSEKGEVDIRWAVVTQFAKDKDLPPLIKLEEIDKTFSRNEAEFIKSCLQRGEAAKIDIQSFNLAFYAWNADVDLENRFLIIPIYDSGKLIGCRILKSTNKHAGKRPKFGGKDKVFSHGRTEGDGKAAAELASLGMHLEKAEKVTDTPKHMAEEEANLRRGIDLGERFVQTVYSIYFWSKKSRIKARVFQNNAGVDFKNFDVKKLSVENKIEITKQLLEALKALKGKGLVHCDIKPRNIFISEENQKPKVVVGDLASMKAEAEVSHTISAAYASPEVAEAYIKFSYAKAELSKAEESQDQTRIKKATENFDSANAELQENLSYQHDLWSMGTVLLYIWNNGNDFPWEFDHFKRYIENPFAILENLASLRQNPTQLYNQVYSILSKTNMPDNIKGVILACLVPDPKDRPTLETILKHTGLVKP